MAPTRRPTRQEREALETLDSIVLTGVRGTGFHGVFESERENGQVFIADVTVWIDSAAAAATDDLAETVHYGLLAEAVLACIQDDPVDLIETLADRIAGRALGFAAAAGVNVTVHKPDAPITVPFTDVVVEITRVRA